jgi:hypothetical protein
MAVKQIAEAHDSRRPACLNQVNQNFEIMVVGLRWYRNTRTPEMIDLAEVKVGDEKGFLGFPENRLLRIQTKQLIQNLYIHTERPYFPEKMQRYKLKGAWATTDQDDFFKRAMKSRAVAPP